MKRFVLAAVLVCASCARGADGLREAAPCWRASKLARTAEAVACFNKLIDSSDPSLKAEGFWGLKDYNSANDWFTKAEKAEPKNPWPHVRHGRLFLERFNPAEAMKSFAMALELQPDYPPALLGLAHIAREGFEKKAVELAEKALAADPKLAEAHELLAWLALEDANQTRAAEQADKALALDSESLDALAIRGAMDLLDEKPRSEWMDRARSLAPASGRAHEVAAHFLILNRRYDEGIAAYEKSVALEPQRFPAHAQLGVNLMRVGREEEARKHLEYCYENSYRDAATVNTLRLLDSYKNFVTFKNDRMILRLHNKEADILRPYFEEQILAALALYDKKYGLKLNRPVQVEVYPDHEDFAVRALGMPGLGALGVTFGTVVAMDSPSARKPGAYHWASTLWHELSHVYSLTATKHRIPRWYTEGLAVYEETATYSDWGDRVDEPVLTAIKEKKLLPVTELERGFVRPSYPAQVIVSYFQAGRICQFIAQRWNQPKLIEMMNDFSSGKVTTAEVIQKRLGLSAEQFDKDFLAWLEGGLKKTLDSFGTWKEGMQKLVRAAKEKKWDDVLRDAPALRDAHPEYVEDHSPYELMAEAWEAKGDAAKAAAELELYSAAGGRNPETLKRLAKWQAAQGRKKEATATLARLNWVIPTGDEELHTRLGELYFDQGDFARGIREYRVAIALKPVDQAQARYNLARTLAAAGRDAEAQEELLEALEAAPGFKPAQKLLLELEARSKKSSGKEPQN